MGFDDLKKPDVDLIKRYRVAKIADDRFIYCDVEKYTGVSRPVYNFYMIESVCDEYMGLGYCRFRLNQDGDSTEWRHLLRIDNVSPARGGTVILDKDTFAKVYGIDDKTEYTDIMKILSKPLHDYLMGFPRLERRVFTMKKICDEKRP